MGVGRTGNVGMRSSFGGAVAYYGAAPASGSAGDRLRAQIDAQLRGDGLVDTRSMPQIQADRTERRETWAESRQNMAEREASGTGIGTVFGDLPWGWIIGGGVVVLGVIVGVGVYRRRRK